DRPQVHLLGRDLSDLARGRSRAGVRWRVWRPDENQLVGLRLVAGVHRAVVGVLGLPEGVPWPRLRGRECHVALVLIRPVPMLVGARHWSCRRVRAAASRAVPVAGSARTCVLRPVVASVPRVSLAAWGLDPDQALAGRGVSLAADGVCDSASTE